MSPVTVPDGAFDIRFRAGAVVHYKLRITLSAPTREALVTAAANCGEGELKELRQGASGWFAEFVQSVNLPRGE